MVDNKITKNKYFYAITVISITVVVSILLIFFVISPFFSKAKQLTAESKAKQEELTKLKEKKAKLEELKDREEELKQEAEKVKNALPEDKDVGRLFIQLDNLAKTTGGNITSVAEASATTTSVTPGESSQSGIKKISYTLPVNFGSYFGFKDFVAKTEGALRLVTIDSFTVSVDDKGSLTGTFSLSAYVRNKK